MKKFLLPLTALALAACTGPGYTSEPASGPNDQPIPYVTGSTYSCTSPDFDLTQTSVLDTGGEYRVDGTVMMPTPGYSYRTVERPSTRLDEQNFEIVMMPSDMMVTQVITPMDVSFSFSGTPTLNRVNIYVVKSDGSAAMNMQPNSVTCTAVR